MVSRIYVEKRPGFDVEAQQLTNELRDILGISRLEDVRLLNRYDVEGISDELFAQCVPTVFSEPPADIVSTEPPRAKRNTTVFAVEYLPGQFDQRAESASECIQLISQGERPLVRSAKVYVLDGSLSSDDVDRIKRYVINPVEAREASLEMAETLKMDFPTPPDVEVLDGFIGLDETHLRAFIDERGLAMDLADLTFCQNYFASERRDPTITEIKMIDTYWSDHCRHTTFGTELDEVEIEDEVVQAAFDRYLAVRHDLNRDDRPVCLMDMATIGARYLKAHDIMHGVDESEEVNACTVRVTCDVDGESQDWLFLFKNETHNHPTEIEPFGGAATCIGGAIRDPLSGRSYVYQAMRLTGAANPLAPVSETLPGKLPQRKLVTTAAEGYSSYGNQIGLATGQVTELYHPDYVAKRMEIGAVVGAAPADHVRRETPAPGDVIVLLGGRTGRDGIGGATGSSKAHGRESLESCGAEVQKGNPPVERKLQRLFRRKDACRLIKRCNDFGAGGVSVAIGELADGLLIDLDCVPKKYDGLDGTELAISESQERMAVALAADDVEEFLGYAREENLEATPVARVTDDERVRMTWRGDTIVDVSREFLASNGAPKHTKVHIERGWGWSPEWPGLDVSKRMHAVVSDLNVCSNKGLAERFDSTIGAATVLMPFGGRRQLTPSMAMVAKLPTDGETSTTSGMAWGFNPYLMSADQFTGAYLSVVESISKLVAAGFRHADAYLSLQEYFEKLRDEPERWGKPTGALLGALMAQLDLGVGAIGGKDSMSGSFEDLDVPPTLVSFAVATGTVRRATSPEFKRGGSRVIAIVPRYRVPGQIDEDDAEGRESDYTEMPSDAEGATPTDMTLADETDVAETTVDPDITAEFTLPVDDVPLLPPCACIPKPQSLLAAFEVVEELIGDGAALAVSTPGYGCLAESVFKMCLGNRLGIELDDGFESEMLFLPAYGSFLVELDDVAQQPVSTHDVRVVPFGLVTEDYQMVVGDETIDLAELQEIWERRLEPVFPYRAAGNEVETVSYVTEQHPWEEPVPQESPDTGDEQTPTTRSTSPHLHIARPRVVIPVFPGSNCEYDSARAFERAGAEVSTFVINNLTPAAVTESTEMLAAEIGHSQIVMIPGGFSGGDEPDGSAKFIAAFFRAPAVADAVHELLYGRDGLMIGICNGFQALVKLGLLPYGSIRPADSTSPTLTFNTIGRHQSRLVHTRVASNLSPWFSRCAVGDVHLVPISHGEGRFVATDETLAQLKANGQIATQYVDEDGIPSLDLDVNPNGSMLAIEGITSPDGRVLGKMGHTERSGFGLYRNVPGDRVQPIIESGVAYFAD